MGEQQVNRARQLIREAAKTGSILPAREAVAILQELGEERPSDALDESLAAVVAGIGNGQGSTFMSALKPLSAYLAEAPAPKPPKPKARKKAKRRSRR